MKDHGTSIKEGLILYGENNFGGRHAAALQHDGADVYIRSSQPENVKSNEKQCDVSPVQVNYKGDSACTKGKPCDIGEGDCDRDTDCKTGLKCGQRNNFE